MVEKLDGFSCDQCNSFKGYEYYFRINSGDFCSLQCYEDFRLKPVVAPKVKRAAKKKKGKKKK